MDRRFTETHLRGLKLLAGLSPSQLEDVSSRLKAARFRQGEAIVREGEPGEELYFLESGRVQVVRGHGDETLVLDELGAGDLFGEMALLTGNPRSATVTALSEVNVWALSRADFDDLVAANPHLALALSRLLSERLRATDARFLQAPRPASAARAAAARPAPRPAPQAAEAVAAPAPKAVPQPKPAARPRPERRPKEQGKGFVAEVSEAFNGLVTWFGGLTTAAKVRLLVVTMLLAWLACIAAPVLVLSTLAADNVTNLQGAIAFVQIETTTPVPATEAVALETPEPELIVPEVPAERVLMAAPAAADEVAAEAGELMAASASEAASPQEVVVLQEEATATPWIVVVTNTPLPPTETPLPTATPQPSPTAVARKVVSPTRVPNTPVPTVAAERAQPSRDLDARLGALKVVIQPVGVQPGQSYWRLVAARWEDESQAAGRHSIYVNVLDENGGRIVGQPVEIRWGSGSVALPTEDKPLNEPGMNFPMYNTLGSYSVSVAGLPSDSIGGLGLGSIEQPNFTVHTCFYLTFQRTTR
jgi:CRP-like cAMP-binding protein